MERAETMFTGEAATARRRPPRPWLAALLSLLQPGLGQLYAWRPGLAAAVWTAFVLGGLLAVRVFVRASSTEGLLVAAVLGTIVLLGPAVHAWRTAARTTIARPPRGRLVAAIAAAAVSRAEQRAIRSHWGDTRRIPGRAMTPAVMAGDDIVTVPIVGQRVLHGEIIVYRDDGGEDQIKRVAGVGGDTLAMRGGALLRNGDALAEPYAQRGGPMYDDTTMAARQRPFLTATLADYRPTADDWGPLVVPTGSLFVLGDNRHTSNDSRYSGFVPLTRVHSRAAYVYFSRDPIGRGVRWSRIGRRLD